MGNKALNGGPHSSVYSDVMLLANLILDFSVRPSLDVFSDFMCFIKLNKDKNVMNNKSC